MTKKLRILLVSAISIMCCTAILAIGVLALFSDGKNVTNHLQAGKLHVKLSRTNLERLILDDDGYLVSDSNNQVVDFTGATDDNVFGIKSDLLIVPQMAFEATMKIEHDDDSTVAFAYWVEIVLVKGSYEAFAEQLEITVTTLDEEGKGDYTVTQTLKKGDITSLTVGSEAAPVGLVPLNGKGLFKVKLQFKDLPNNNDVQNREVSFDLIVHAIQDTTKN